MKRLGCAVVLIGPPGSGKTTMGRGLAGQRPMTIIEVGNLLSREVRNGTKLGEGIKPYTSAGRLAPMEFVEQVISRELLKAQRKVVLFDGVPRSTEQIEPFFALLGRHDLRLCAVIVLTLELSTALHRLSGRRICTSCGAVYNIGRGDWRRDSSCPECGGQVIQRDDDREDVVRERFRRFQRETEPVIEFFRNEFASLVVEQSTEVEQEERNEHVRRHLEARLAREA